MYYNPDIILMGYTVLNQHYMEMDFNNFIRNVIAANIFCDFGSLYQGLIELQKWYWLILVFYSGNAVPPTHIYRVCLPHTSWHMGWFPFPFALQTQPFQPRKVNHFSPEDSWEHDYLLWQYLTSEKLNIIIIIFLFSTNSISDICYHFKVLNF